MSISKSESVHTKPYLRYHCLPFFEDILVVIVTVTTKHTNQLVVINGKSSKANTHTHQHVSSPLFPFSAITTNTHFDPQVRLEHRAILVGTAEDENALIVGGGRGQKLPLDGTMDFQS